MTHLVSLGRLLLSHQLQPQSNKLQLWLRKLLKMIHGLPLALAKLHPSLSNLNSPTRVLLP